MTKPAMTDAERATILDLIRRGWRLAVEAPRSTTKPEEADLRVRQFAEALADLEKGVAAGTIPNARYETAKYTVSFGFDVACGFLVERPVRQLRDERPELASPSAPAALRKVGGWFDPKLTTLARDHARMADAAALDAGYAPFAEILAAFLPVHAILTAARAVAVKKLRGEDLAKAKAEAAAALPPVVESEATATVRRVLEELTQSAADAIRDREKARIVDKLERFMAHQDKAVAEGLPIRPDFMDEFFTVATGRRGRFFDQDGYFNTHALVEKAGKAPVGGGELRRRIEGWEIAAEKKAESRARAVRDAFVAKNVAKIGPVCDAKPETPTVSQGKIDISIESFFGEVVVAFPDGSGFVARNGIVHNVSVNGTWFVQYPLRFHDVRFPDGTKAKFESEAGMGKRFRPA